MPATAPAPAPDCSTSSPQRIAELADGLTRNMADAVKQIKDVNGRTRLLSFNAQIEAARAGGTTGAAFGVVAQSIQQLSGRTAAVAEGLATETQESITELNRISQQLDSEVRGERLAAVGHNSIDLIDRNLFERTCDVRWWATDSSLVDALSEPTEASLAHASRRMGVILSAYTVYHDLVLADCAGNVVANGRPERYQSVGSAVGDAAWYRSAAAGRSGDEYGFEGLHRSPLAGGERSLVYSCTVRTGGEARGEVLGVLGIVFKWDDLAQTIVDEAPLLPGEAERTRVCVVDDAGRVLADAGPPIGSDADPGKVDAGRLASFREARGFSLEEIGGRDVLAAHAASPGYEGYRTGWHALVLQQAA